MKSVVEDEQMSQVDSGEQNAVFGPGAKEGWGSVRSTGGSLPECRSGPSEKESEVAAGIHGSWADCQVLLKSAPHRTGAAGRDGGPLGFARGVEGKGIARGQCAMASAVVSHLFHDSLPIQSASGAPAAGAHIEVWSDARDIAHKMAKGRLRLVAEETRVVALIVAQLVRSCGRASAQAQSLSC